MRTSTPVEIKVVGPKVRTIYQQRANGFNREVVRTLTRKALSARDREEQAKRELVSLGLWCVALPAVVALACWLGGKLS
jgi:hypothetical protein